MIYGIPYKGSKNKLAEKILAQLPKAETLYDLFSGGMAITHAALQGNKFKKVVANDINGEMGTLFENAMNGKYEQNEEWVSRSDFFMFKDSDPFIKYAWSFGFNGETYLYSKEVEPIKRAMHKVVFSKTQIGRKNALRGLSDELNKIQIEKKKLYNYIEELCHENEFECAKRKDGTIDIVWVKKTLKEALERNTLSYMRNALLKSGKTQTDIDRYLGNQMAGHYFGKSQFALPTMEQYKKIQELIPGLNKDYFVLKDELKEALCTLEALDNLENLEGLSGCLDHLESYSNSERIKSLQYVQGKEKLKRLVGNYQDVIIEPNSVVYCDPPYINTSGYGCEFDHGEFYDWLETLEVPVFISEYWMPEDRFVCVKEFDYTQSFSGTGAKKVIERLFVPIGQYKEELKLF